MTKITMKNLRRQRLKELLASSRFKGDREKFCLAAGISKGRLSQLLDDKEPFGDVAEQNLVDSLSLPKNYFTKSNTAPTMGTDEFSLTPILAWDFAEELPEGEYVLIPRLDVRLSAGNGRTQVEFEISKRQPQAFRADWIREKNLTPNRLASMKVDGDSMVPFLFHGDTVVVDTTHAEIKDGKVYALWYDGGERVKRLWRLPGGGLRIKSDNPEHDTIDVSGSALEDVRILGRVVHKQGDGGL